MVISPNIESQLAALVNRHATRHGLVVQPQPFRGQCMVFPDLRTGEQRILTLDLTPPYWRDVAAAEIPVISAAVGLINAFAHRHGPGKVWTLEGLPLVHLVSDDGVMWRREDPAASPWGRVRMLAAHEAAMQ